MSYQVAICRACDLDSSKQDAPRVLADVKQLQCARFGRTAGCDTELWSSAAVLHNTLSYLSCACAQHQLQALSTRIYTST
jgi:hypothetical protein